MNGTTNQILIGQFLLGNVVFACFTISIFFFRFWRRTRDRLFACFAIAFILLGVNWLALAFAEQDEVRTALYMVRLIAFVLILFAIYDKNWPTKRGASLAVPPDNRRS